MNPKLYIIVLVRGLPLLGLSFSASAQLFNGSFELPANPPETRPVASPDGWTGGVRLINGTGGAPLYYPPPAAGNQYMDLGPGPSGLLSQTFNIDQPGLMWTLTWSGASSLGVGPGFAPHTARILDAGNQILATGNFDEGNFGAWTIESLGPIGLGVGSYQVQFEGFDGHGATLIDNVQLIAVPEPAAYAAFTGLALAGFTIGRRWRR